MTIHIGFKGTCERRDLHCHLSRYNVSSFDWIDLLFFVSLMERERIFLRHNSMNISLNDDDVAKIKINHLIKKRPKKLR